MFEEIKNWWVGVKNWFKNSESIFLARLATFGGFFTTMFASLDWSPLWSILQTGTDFTQKQLLGIGVAVLGSGIMLELARRRGTKEVESTLIPTAAAVAPIKIKIKTKTPKKGA